MKFNISGLVRLKESHMRNFPWLLFCAAVSRMFQKSHWTGNYLAQGHSGSFHLDTDSSSATVRVPGCVLAEARLLVLL